jgi:hypothetical protein
MIYALKYGSVSSKVRQEIRLAIARQGDLTPFAAQGVIAHIAGSHPGGDYHCLYCGDQLKPYALARPGKRVPADNWYFQHMGKNKCSGPASTPTSDFKNPAGHGCYVCLGCETDDAGMLTAQSRTRCHTIVNGQTYCHLAQIEACIPGAAQSTEPSDGLDEATETTEVTEATEAAESREVAGKAQSAAAATGIPEAVILGASTEAADAPEAAKPPKPPKATRAKRATKATAPVSMAEIAEAASPVAAAEATVAAEPAKAAKPPKAVKAKKSTKATEPNSAAEVTSETTGASEPAVS